MGSSSGGMIPWKPAGPDYEPTPKMRREEMVVRRFHEEKKRQEKARDEYHRMKLGAALHMRERQHKMIYEEFQRKLDKHRLERTYNFAVITSLEEAWKNLEQLDLASYIVVDQRGITKRMQGKEGLRTSTRDDIHAFESKGYELGAEPKEEESADTKKKPAKPPPKGKAEPTPKVDPALLAQLGKAYLDDVIARKGREDSERFEIQQRKRKEELEQIEREKELEEASKKEEEEQAVQKKLEEELRQAEILRMAQAEEESIRAYRRMLEEQIAEQRSREWEAVLARDRELLSMMRQDCFDEVEHEHRLVEAEKKRKIENRKARHREMCREILLQITSLSESRAHYRECTDSDLPMLEWREWQTLFVKGALLPSPSYGEMTSSESESGEETLVADEAAAMEYFQELGEWTGVIPIEKNKELGVILRVIHDMADVPPKPVPIPHLSEMTLKLAAIGTPYSGKSTTSKAICADFGIITIEMDKVLASAIAEAEAEEANQPQPQPEHQSAETHATVATESTEPSPQPTEAPAELQIEAEPPPPPPPTRAQLGKSAKIFIQQGLQVPADLLVSLLVITISDLHSTEEASKPPPKKPPPKDKKGGKNVEVEVNITGFIIDGFPNTAEEAAALEKVLTGLDLEFAARHEAAASVLAPPPPIEKVDKFVSGLDGIFLMECPTEEIALNRALGKRVDSKTGLFYHLDYDPPPPTDKTGITSRLQPVEEPDAARIRILEGMQVWPGVLSWMDKFKNVYWVAQEVNGKLKTEDAVKVVKEFIAAKVLADVAAAAAKAAHDAEEATKAALEETDKAKIGCDIASRHLYFAKVGEIEAAAVLESFPADPLAKETLKVKASTVAGQKLNEAVKALKEIQNAVEMAQKASLQAHEAAQKAQEAVGGTEACFQAKADAEAAAEAARQAASRASLASQKAGFTFDAASQELAKIEKPDEVVEEHKEENEDVAKAEPIVKPAYPELELPVAVGLHFTWTQIESLYFSRLKDLFRTLRVERANGRNILQEIKVNFAAFLKRPDNKQKVFDDFQAKYNRIDIQDRRTAKIKQTLKKSVDDLAKQLRAICDLRLKEAQETCKKRLGDWVAERTASCVSYFTSLIQIEMDRHLQSCAFLHEFYFRKPSAIVLDMFTPVMNLVETAQLPPKTFPVPGWITGIAASSPQVSQILTKAVFLVDGILKAASDCDLESRSRAGGKTKASTKAETPLQSGPAPMLREHEIIQSRLQLLASKACTYMGELQPLVDGAAKRMEQWMTSCYEVETSLVSEVLDLSNEAVEEAIPLWYHMNLDGGELVIHEEHIIVDPPPPLAVEPVIDLNIWHFRLLHSLVEVLRAVSPTGYIEVKDATATLLQAIETAHLKGKDDVNFARVPHLPATKGRPYGPFQVWLDYMNQVLKKVQVAKAEAETVQLVDWRALLVTLADMHCNDCISASAVEDVKQVCILLDEGSRQTNGLLSLENFVAIPFWFDQAANQGAADIGTELKNLVHQMLQPVPPVQVSDKAGDAPAALVQTKADPGAAAGPAPLSGEETPQPEIPWQRLALYFCRDENKEKALSKVFQVIIGTCSDVLELKPDQLLQAIYHLSLEEASSTGCLAWAVEDLRELALKIKSEMAPQPTPSVEESEEDTESEKYCTRSTVAHRGSNLSDQTNLTVRDFGVMDMIPDDELSMAELPAIRENICSELSEHDAETIKQFLDALSPTPREQEPQSPPLLKDESGDEVVERQVSVDEILGATCAAHLCSILLENYSSKQIHVINVKKPVDGEISRPKEEFNTS